MSLHRYAAKRDDNEPEIRKRFAHHGWHTEALSAKGMPDLIVFPRPHGMQGLPDTETRSVLVDVKDKGGAPTKAQVEKWTALHAKGVPVYIARTTEDVDAIVAGKAEAWVPRTLTTVTADAGKPMHVVREPGTGSRRVRRKANGRPDPRNPDCTCPDRACPAGQSCNNPALTPRGMSVPDRGQNRKKECGCLRSLGRCTHGPSYTPPRSTGVDSAKEAEATFAPHELDCVCDTCLENAP